jgi:hypothetical protein
MLDAQTGGTIARRAKVRTFFITAGFIFGWKL